MSQPHGRRHTPRMSDTADKPSSPNEPRGAVRGPRRLLRKLLLSLAALIVALGAAEGVLHLLGVEVRAERLVRHPILGWRNRPGWQGPVFSINSLGFLGEEFEPQKPAGTIRIFCLGGSCTAGDLLPSFGDTYPRQLERLLRRRYPEAAVEVINAGVGGYSSLQGRLWLEREILGYGPDLVVLYFGWNDHWPARAGGEDKVVAGSWSERVRAWLAWCKLLQLAIRAGHILRGQAMLPRTDLAPPSPSLSDRPPRVSLDDYAENLRAMIRAVREGGGEAVLVTAPTYLAVAVAAESPWPDRVRLDRATAEALVPLHARYNDVVRRVAEEQSACLVDAAAELLERDDAALLFWTRADGSLDFIHLSADGYRWLSAAVADTEAVKRLFGGR